MDTKGIEAVSLNILYPSYDYPDRHQFYFLTQKLIVSIPI